MLDRLICLLGIALILCGMLASAGEPLSDPTRPDYSDSSPAQPGASFKVTAIFYSAERQHAVVNGKVVSSGDRVDGARVVAIRSDALDLVYRGESITRRLPAVELRKQ